MNKITLTTTVGLLLAAISPSQSHAGNNTWKGSSGGLWDNSTSGNWLAPLIWNNGDTALFYGGAGASPVNLGATVTSSGLTFTAPNYVINATADGNNLNLSTPATIANYGTNVSIAAQITGTDGLVYTGSGDLLLRGNTTGGSGPSAGSPNTYTGPTYVRGGTLLLQVTNQTTAVGGNNLNNHGALWAVSRIDAIDALATVRLANYPIVSGGVTNANYQVPRGQIQENTHIILTGGTLDGNGEDNLQNYPAIIGTGFLVNSSQIARSVYKMNAPDTATIPVAGDSYQHVTNSAVIGDLSPMTPSVISGKIAHEIDFDLGNSGRTEWLFNGESLPTMGGSWRLSGSQILKFAGGGSLGTPNYFTTPNTVRLNGSNPANVLDLNGTSQTTGGFAGSGSSTGNGGLPNAIVCNGNPGTTSIMTIGAANLGLNALPAITTNGITYTPGSGSVTGIAFTDTTSGVNTNLSTGGILGITKVGTNIARFTGTFAISGPLVVSGGELDIIPGQGSGATPILNGPVYLSTGTTLGLFTASGNSVIQVPALYIDGVPQPKGTYGAIGNTAGATGIAQISNGGSPNGDVLQVVGVPSPTLTKSGNNAVVTWDDASGKFTLQVKSNSVAGPWFDSSLSSPATFAMQSPSMFFRLVPMSAWQSIFANNPGNNWKNTSGNSTWDTTSVNWTSPTVWANGGNAQFSDIGAGNITVNGPITASSAVFSGNNGYTLTGNQSPTSNGSNDLVNMGPITANTSLTIAATIAGTNGLTIQGTGTVTLTGDSSYGGANIYSGPTKIKGGTVILQSTGASSGGATYALGNITQLDSGATVVIGTTYGEAFTNSTFLSDVSNNAVAIVSVPDGQIARNTFNNTGLPGTGSTIPRLTMTGGVLDLNADQSSTLPLPDGTGIIYNTSPVRGASLVFNSDGGTHTFSGVIGDGGPAYQTAGNNNEPYQTKIMNLAGSGGTLILAGPNTYSGSTRLGGSTSIKMQGFGTLGSPSDTIPGMTGPMRLYDPNTIDLNGTSQTVGNITTAGTPSATPQIFNSAVGTTSTFNFGKALETTYRNLAVGITDNKGTGGKVSLRYVGSSNNYPHSVTGVNNYSGDTILAGTGTLCFGGRYDQSATSTPNGISSNSAIKLTSGLGTLALNYTGTANIPALYVNGIKMPAGTYGASTVNWNGQPAPTIIGTGTLTVP